MQPSNALDPEDGSYEELLAMWADLEAGLSIVLLAPGHILDFQKKIGQYDGWMRGLLERDADIALYLLFQLAATSTAGYSASHALVCAVLCHITAIELNLPSAERDSLVRAAMTMNVSLTALQNVLALQTAKLSGPQRATLHQHGEQGRTLLRQRGVVEPLWLALVAAHHDEFNATDVGISAPPERRLARLLQMIDRYGAMISPRKSRSARSVSESLRAVVGGAGGRRDELEEALVRAVGACPPGSFVRLTNGETAVVLRRGESFEDPVIAILSDHRGRPVSPPRLLNRAATGAPKIDTALSSGVVDLRLNHRTMVQLGLFAARKSRRVVAA